MTKAELVSDMKQSLGSSFVTRKKLSEYLGVSLRTADKYLLPLNKVSGQLYFVGDVADSILRGGGA